MATDNSVIRIGINGFGRIGRMVLRACLNQPEVQVVAVNDPFLPPDYMAYQLRYDSTQGAFPGEVVAEEKDANVLKITYNGEESQVVIFAEKDPGAIAWESVGVHYVIESTGIFLSAEKAGAHMYKKDEVGENGQPIRKETSVRRVILSAPSKSESAGTQGRAEPLPAPPMYVMGVNEEQYLADGKPAILSNASCTTNCLAPVVKVLYEEFGIESGLMTTVHAVTATQKTVDAPSKKWRSGRGAFQNIIPASTGAAKAVGKVFPAVNGKLNGMAFRVPVPDGSVVDLTCTLGRPVTKEELKAKMLEWANDKMQGVLQYTEDLIVSSDIIGNPHSSIFDADASMVLPDSNMVKVISWYDNEWGYSNRLVDLVKYVAANE